MDYTIEYQGGHPLWAKPDKCILAIRKELKAVYLKPKSSFSTLQTITINVSDIVSVDYEKSSSRSAGKAVAGALVGGVLTGGIGLLVGGALGAKKKNQSELYLTIRYNDRDFVVSLKTGKETDKIYSEINSLFA